MFAQIFPAGASGHDRSNCPPEAQGNEKSPGGNRGDNPTEGGEVPGKPTVALYDKGIVSPAVPQRKEKAMQRRKKCTPKQSRKGRVNKSKARRAAPRRHQSKYCN